MWTYVEKAKLRADVEDPAGGQGLPEQRQERLSQHPCPVEVSPEHRLGVLHRVGVDLVERYGSIVHLHASKNRQIRNMTSAPPESALIWPPTNFSILRTSLVKQGYKTHIAISQSLPVYR
jgi:hypothetical protein